MRIAHLALGCGINQIDALLDQLRKRLLIAIPGVVMEQLFVGRLVRHGSTNKLPLD